MAQDSLHTLADLVSGFAARADAPVVHEFRRDGRRTVRYGELAEEVRALAAGLTEAGVGPGDFVLLWAPNSAEWIASYFAVVLTRAAAIPLDNQSSTESAAGVLAHARPKVLLTTAAHAEALAAAPEALGDTRVFLLDAAETDERSVERLRRAARDDLPAPRPDDVASLLYTSGTTGTPKAVPLTHANLIANATALLEARLVRAADRVLMPLPLHHTYPFTIGLLTVLGTGAALILPSGMTGPEIGRAATEARATALLAVPRLAVALWEGVESAVRARGERQTRFFFRMLDFSIAVRRHTGLRLGKLLFRAVHARLGKDLDLIGCGGAKLGADLEWKLEGLGWRVLTGYGLTETSPVLTFNRPGAVRLGSEGRPLPGVELRIDPVPGQVHGEIVARGPNVFAGYWANPEATREAFTADGWFRTGDLGFLDEDGYLHIVGRSKEVIVLPDGKNVFPEDVEKAYAQSPLFKEIAVLEHQGRLAALIVPDDDEVRRRGAVRAAALLREELEEVAQRLPPYQRVGQYRLTREPLPRTQLGKLRRHLLPDIYAQSATAEAARPPEALTEEDKKLLETGVTAEIWRWLGERYPDRPLTLETSPQLDLQIDSLEWVTMTLELEQRFGVTLSGEAVSRVMSLRDLLREAEQARTAPQPAAAPPPAVRRPGPLLAALGLLLFAVARLLVRSLYRFEAAGAERLNSARPLVFTPNHTSYLDPLVVAAALPWKRLRQTYWAGWVGIMYKGPVRRLVSRATRVLPVDPDRDLAAAIRAARALVEQGYDLVWFPEGRRSPSGKLEPFQAGIGVLLEGSDAEVVPTAIRGAFEAWPRDARRPRLGGRITVTFGEPVAVGALERAAAPDARRPEAIRCALERQVAALLGEAAPASAE
ncbi:MAG TPA: AMP-binding protein [Gammaproteobacteria bacterium]